MAVTHMQCWCGSGHNAEDCCAPILAGERRAATAEELMRSRYSANVTGNTGYLLASWHPSTRPRSMDAGRIPRWCGLTILAREKGGPEDTAGMVEFQAHYRDGATVRVLHERSRFVRENDRWYYLDGELMVTPPQAAPRVGRNDSCPCGSGKKYKKCCLGRENL
jgi:SEC-C motif-containing protein